MVRRFRYLTRYPDQYPKSLPDNQSSVPSQHSPVPLPFDPSQHPDLQSVSSPNISDQAIVRATFDSRPKFAFDFYLNELFLAGVPFNGAGTSGYTVPNGYNLFLRKINIAMSVTELGGGGIVKVINPFGGIAAGDGVVPPFLRILVDGQPTRSFTPGNVQLMDALISEVDFPVFVPVPGGSRIQIILPGFATDTAVASPWDTYVHYYGNLLAATGRNLDAEMGNADPLPVHEVGQI